LWSAPPPVPKTKKTRPLTDDTWVNVKIKDAGIADKPDVYGRDTAEYVAYQIIDLLTELLGHAGKRPAQIKEERIFKQEE
jgi:hypothetical protein